MTELASNPLPTESSLPPEPCCANCDERLTELLTEAWLAGWPQADWLCVTCVGYLHTFGKLPDVQLTWCKIDPDGPGLHAPKRPGDAGFDLCAAETISLVPGVQRDIPTNIRVSLPRTLWGEIRPRSSVARLGLQTEAGIIDSCFTGPLFVFMRNLNTRPHLGTDWLGRVTVQRGQRIGQLLLHHRRSASVKQVDHVPDDPRRGGAGFGSTGK